MMALLIDDSDGDSGLVIALGVVCAGVGVAFGDVGEGEQVQQLAPVHAQSARSHQAASAANAARWPKQLLSPGLGVSIISG